MSFINVFEELSKLYESKEEQPAVETAEDEEVLEEAFEEEQAEEEVVEEGLVGNAIGSFVGTAAANALTEEDEEPEEVEEVETEDSEEIEVEDDEGVAVEEPRQLILECTNCGGLVIKAEADVTVDEESDLANVGEACQYCENDGGFKIVGVVAPYGSEEELEEGIFSFGKKKNKNTGKSAQEEREVTFTIYNEHGTEQFSHTFTELPGKANAEEQLGVLLKNSYPRVYQGCKDNGSKWQYERVSEPADPRDTKRNRNYFVSQLYLR